MFRLLHSDFARVNDILMQHAQLLRYNFVLSSCVLLLFNFNTVGRCGVNGHLLHWVVKIFCNALMYVLLVWLLYMFGHLHS